MELSEPPSHGPQTALALENFPGHGRRMNDVPAFVRGYAQVKCACAAANVALGVVDLVRGGAIQRAASRVAALENLDLFPVPVVQGGGGTSTNMNMNEVIAKGAERHLREGGNDGPFLEVHPNDHVNASQSTNDTYPTAMAVTLMQQGRSATAALAQLEGTLDEQAARWDDHKRLGRTCLRDAVSLTIGATHRTQAAIVSSTRADLETALASLAEVPLGGTVLGTGVGAPDGFAELAVRSLADLTGLPLRPARNRFAAMAHPASLITLADACKAAAVALSRVASDIRWLSAGPAGGPGEIVLPRLQAGSSIMPGKVNPIVPELVMQLGFRVRGAAYAVDLAVAAGELELNVMEPVMLDALLTCLEDVAAAADVLERKCVRGLSWSTGRVEASLSGALDEYVELARSRGYSTVSSEVATASGDRH